MPGTPEEPPKLSPPGLAMAMTGLGLATVATLVVVLKGRPGAVKPEGRPVPATLCAETDPEVKAAAMARRLVRTVRTGRVIACVFLRERGWPG